jgi:predicted AAA+ superfamily ATPase
MEIDIKLLKIQNQWWDSGDLKYDPVIETLDKQFVKYRPKAMDEIDLQSEKMTLLQGARGVGKTTIIKMMIAELISKKKVNPQNIFYYSCHNLNSKEQLNESIKTFVNWRRQQKKNSSVLYIFIDEVTLLKNWNRGIGHLERAGIFKNIRVLLSGSVYFDITKLSNQSRIKWENIKVKSLSFREVLAILDSDLLAKLDRDKKKFTKYKDRLEYYLNIYFLTGGYLSAINSFLKEGAVKQDIYSSYLYWLIADVARADRDLVLFRQIVEQLINFQGQSFGFQTIARKTKARTHNTVSDYIGLLQSMFVFQIIYQLDDQNLINKRAAKRMYFRDPFIFWVFYSYLHGSLNYWQFSREYIHNKYIFDALLQNVVFSHLLKNENFDNWEKSLAFERSQSKGNGINFVDISVRSNRAILIRYNKKISNADKSLFRQAGFSKGIIISHDILEEGKIKIMPLSYFLLYY